MNKLENIYIIVNNEWYIRANQIGNEELKVIYKVFAVEGKERCTNITNRPSHNCAFHILSDQLNRLG